MEEEEQLKQEKLKIQQEREIQRKAQEEANRKRKQEELDRLKAEAEEKARIAKLKREEKERRAAERAAQMDAELGAIEQERMKVRGLFGVVRCVIISVLSDFYPS